jgi:hypothetical protein
MITTKRTYPLAFIENGITEIKLPRNHVELHGMVSVKYADNVTVAGTAVRARGSPIKRISLIGDNGKVLHSIKPQDAIRKAEIYEQTALAQLVTVAAGAGIANNTNLTADIPLFFRQPFAENGDLTSLPTWIYDELTLRIEWGGHAEVIVGGTGAVTVATGDATFTLMGAADFGRIADPIAFGRSLGVSVDRYKEAATGGAAATEFTIELPTTADVRALLVVAEDANGEPTNALINKITLLENNTVRVYSGVAARALRADNARVFGVGMPPGTYVLEFAEDMDIASIYGATAKDDLDLVLDVAAVAGAVVRVHQITIEPPRAA